MIVDAKVLLYAVDDQSHFHIAARTWMDEATTRSSGDLPHRMSGNPDLGTATS